MASFHSTYAWQKARRIARIEAKHICAECGKFAPEPNGLHTHHRKPLRKSMALAFEPLNLQVVCPQCHNRIEPRNGGPPRIRSGCDEAGRPTDSRHPWYQKDQ
jgi:5-methylcytosine-specific restriction endonuclease McrA